ncbi:MAG TPA: ISNCY family transposase [Fervidobacterium sp.]|nr:ISNCY family transposase [Fervidobacterium sp.]
MNQTIDKVITIREAAELLGLSERQVIRLKKGVVEEGPAFIIHKNRGRKPQHTLPDEVRMKIVELKQTKYQEANFNHFVELLEEHEDIKVSYTSVHRILTQAGIKSPKKHRKRKSHHRRKRKPQRGMLVQIDASPHEWIIGGELFTLHGAIDDATGEILALFFTPNECMEGYFEIIRQIVKNYGIPMSLYCDRHTIFVSPNDGKLSIEDQLKGKTVNLTQFGRAMEELGITIIKANSPQAKGRIEKLWDTLQSRLPVEFKIRGIDTMEAANAFLSQFIVAYNEKFAVEPENPEPAFRPLEPGIEFDHILCIKEERTIIEDSAFSYKGKYYQLVRNGRKAAAMPKAKLTVLSSSKIGVKALYAGVVYDTLVLEERPKKKALKSSKKQPQKRTPVKPAADHPWRQMPQKRPNFAYEETDREIIEMLNQLFNSTRAWA